MTRRLGIASVRAVILLLIAVAVGSCDEAPSAPSPVDVQFTLAPGESAGVAGADLSVRFDAVSSDSRCPIDAICVTGGDAVVHITAVSGGTSTPYELHTGNMLPVRHADVTITLVELQPYPFSAHPVEPGDYRATLRVTR